MNQAGRRISLATGTVSALVALLALAAVSSAENRGGTAAGPAGASHAQRIGNAGSGGQRRGGGTTGKSLALRWASLRQDGQQLVWRVQLTQPFSAAKLARGHVALCLQMELVSSGHGQLCVIPPAHNSAAPQLNYVSAKSRRALVSSAVVTQTSPTTLMASFLPTAIGIGYSPLRWQAISALGSGACTTEPHGGGDICSTLYPAKPSLLRLHTPVLVGCVASGPSLVFAGSLREREIALTFDDGPWNDPPTSAFLNVLEREHVPATFFEIGRQISTYDPLGAAERRMLADGDMIGDHTWSHPDMAKLPASEQRAQLLDTAAAIKRATGGFTPCLWRPPYGATSPSLIALARSLGFLTIMWDIDPRDWALPGVGAIYSNVVGNAHNGAIVIQHFGGGPRYETLAALPQEIDTLRSKGYRFVTVDRLLGLRLVYR